MKRPTIEEVRERFKSVTHILSQGTNHILPINTELRGIYESEVIPGAYCECESGIILYHPQHGFSIMANADKDLRFQEDKDLGFQEDKLRIREYRYCIDLAIDFRFWSSGCINLNFHDGFTFEIEFLCFGLYMGRRVENTN